jgi:formylglycine-generating enzyme required for sulfatase activity
MKDRGYEIHDFWTTEGQKWLEQNKITKPLIWRDRTYNCPTSPVVGVSWYEAVAFCNWLSASKKDGLVYRLPTEEEWQAAAAGKEKREYPWGDKIDPHKCNYDESELGRPSPVGIFLDGKTPEGGS